MTFRAIVQACRPLAHGNIAPPILYGQALAIAAGAEPSLAMFALAHAFGVLDHVAIVCTNDLADREDDARNLAPTLFSGGSRVLVEGKLAPRTVGAMAGSTAVGLVALSLALAPSRPLLPWLAVAALLLLTAYCHPPLRLSYRGGGEWLQGLGVGVVLPLVGFHAQGAGLALPWASLVPSFVLGVAGHVMTALPDAPADRLAGKRTWPVRRGEARARRELVGLVALGIALGAAMLPLGGAGAVLALAPLLPLGAAARLAPRAAPGDPALLRFVVTTGGASTGALLLWSLALLLSR